MPTTQTQDALIAEEMFSVLDVIVLEFRFDPTSVQCFDARLVARAKAVVEAYREARGRAA